MKMMGHRLKDFIPGFIILFVGSLFIFYRGRSETHAGFQYGSPLLALIVGLIISNVMKMPAWMKVSLRTEYYIKTGIVLSVRHCLLPSSSRPAPSPLLQATIVSVVTWLAIYLAATKIFKLEPQFGAVLGAGGAVCGVSASIAVGGAVKAKNEHISISIAVVTVWAIIMIFVLTFAMKQVVPETSSPGRGRRHRRDLGICRCCRICRSGRTGHPFRRRAYSDLHPHESHRPGYLDRHLVPYSGHCFGHVLGNKTGEKKSAVGAGIIWETISQSLSSDFWRLPSLRALSPWCRRIMSARPTGGKNQGQGVQGGFHPIPGTAANSPTA